MGYSIVDIFLHLDLYLNDGIALFGPWIYLVLFLVIFCETGLVVTPFLPGDSLLFAVGTLAATDQTPLRLPTLVVVLIGAAILGDTINYAVGYRIGPKVFQREEGRWFHKRHLMTTQAFYERHGGKTIILARFLPIIRTFAPFVAGVGKMAYSRFIVFNITGGVLWVLFFLIGGYYFGNIPVIKEHFEFAVLGIIVVSCLPLIIRVVRASRANSITPPLPPSNSPPLR